jgi:corrinoid protein of di/trimethylamine methyltransferase
MQKDEILKKLADAVVAGDEETCRKGAKDALEAGIDPYEAIMDGCTAGMVVVSDKYEKKEMFVPEILLSAEAMYAAIEVLRPYLKAEEAAAKGTVVLGVCEGDIHDIGKSLVKIMLDISGFKVIDLGRNVTLHRFVDSAKENNAQVIAMSALMTTSMLGMEVVIKMLEEQGLRDKIKTIIGGAAVGTAYAEDIGADAYEEDAARGAKRVATLVELVGGG